MRIIERIVSTVGRRIDESSPMVDARLLDGSRVNAIIPPLALDGPALSIRRFRTDGSARRIWSTCQSLTPPMLDFLKACVACAAQRHHLGRHRRRQDDAAEHPLELHLATTSASITIEDAAELMLRQRHVVRLETRPANIEGKGAIKQRQLVINALRMRPDRIVVGEVRGEEAVDMLQAMNTGHDGSLTTDPREQPARRAVPSRHDGRDGGPEPAGQGDPAADRVGDQLIVQVTRLSDGTRRVTNITEITGMEGDVITMQDIFLFEKTGVNQDGKVHGPLPRDRHPAEGQRAARRRRHAAAGGHVRARAAGAVGRSRMLIPLLVFGGVVAIVLGAYYLFVVRDEEKFIERLQPEVRGVADSARRPEKGRAEGQLRRPDQPDALSGSGGFTASLKDFLKQAGLKMNVVELPAVLRVSRPRRLPARRDAVWPADHRSGRRRVRLGFAPYMYGRYRADQAHAGVRRAVPGVDRPGRARAARRARAADRTRHGGRRDAGAGRHRVPDPLRRAELRPVAAGRDAEFRRAHPAASTRGSSSPRCSPSASRAATSPRCSTTWRRSSVTGSRSSVRSASCPRTAASPA